jgi:hypothetical protein
MKKVFLVAAVLLAAGVMRQGESSAQVRAKSLTCPLEMEVTEQGSAPGLSADWKTPAVKSTHTLEGITIYNDEMGDESASLAPDDESRSGVHVKQTWQVKDYRDHNVWLQCRYRNTKATLAVNIPAAIQTCHLAFDVDGKGNVTNKPALDCR